jgi:hypothetical protein
LSLPEINIPPWTDTNIRRDNGGRLRPIVRPQHNTRVTCQRSHEMEWGQILPFLNYGAMGVSAVAMVYALGWNVLIAKRAGSLPVEKLRELRRQARETFLFAGAFLLVAVGAHVVDGWRRTYLVHFDLAPIDFLERAAETPGLKDVKKPISIKLAGSEAFADFVSGNTHLDIVDGSAVSVDVTPMFRVFEQNKALSEALKVVQSDHTGLTEQTP